MQVLYDLGVRLNLSYSGFQTGALAAGGLLKGLEGQMLAAERRAGLLAKAFGNMNWSAPGASSFGAALANQFTAAGSAAQTAQARVDKFHRSMNIALGGAALTGAGLVMASLLGKAGQAGAQLQLAMTGIAQATGATPKQLAAMQSSFVPIGLRNQMNVTDVANIALASTHAGITDLGQLRGSIATIANFAEVQQLSTHVSRESAATTAVEFAHLFNAYTPQLLNPLINVLSKALTHTPLSGKGFETLVSQFSGMVNPLYGRSAKGLLRSETDDTMMGVLLGQMGQGPRGGTQFGSGLIHMLKARPGSGAYAAEQRLEQLGGGRFTTADGTYLGNKNLLTILTRARQHMTDTQALQANFWAFGSVGMKLFGNLETPARLQQWDVNARTFARIPGIDKQQEAYNATAAGQSQQWHKNVETVVQTFGTALLPTLLRVSQALVGITRGVVEFMRANPGVVQFAATFALVATAVALIGGPILVAIGAIGMLAVAIGALEAIAWPITAAVLGITAAIAAGILIFQHWSTVVSFLNNPLGALAGKFGPIGQGIALVSLPLIGLIDGLRLLWEWGSRLVEWAGGLAGVAGVISAALTVAFAPLAGAIEALKMVHGFWDWLTGAAAPKTQAVKGAPSVPVGVHALGGTTVGLRPTIPAVHLPPKGAWPKPPAFPHGYIPPTHLIGPVPRPRPGAYTPPTSGHAGYVWRDPWAYTPPPVHAPLVHAPPVHPAPVGPPVPRGYHAPVVHSTPAPPLIPRKSGGMALIGAGSLQASRTIEVHHHHHGSPVSIAINGADHATTNDLATVVAKRVRHEITASARWHNRYHGKGLLNMEPT